MRDRICKYNVAVGIENTKPRGDRETITLFWMRIIFNHFISEMQDRELVDIANDLLNTYKDSALIFEYYSRALLLSYKARISWVESDIKLFNYSIDFDF